MLNLIASAVADLGLGSDLLDQTEDTVLNQKKKLQKPPVPDNAFGTNLMSNAVTDLGIR